MDNQAILQSSDGPILSLTLNRPHARNAFNLPLARALVKALEGASLDEAHRIVVIRGAGGAFSAGGDLKFFQEQIKTGDKQYQQIFQLLNEAIHFIRDMPRPVVAAIQGPAYAAGFGLALACDLAVASQSASLSPSFINVGLAPNASSTVFLPRLIGPRAAMEAFMRGRVFSAREALELGIINQVWEDGEFEERLQSYVRELATRPSGTLSRIKQLLNASLSQGWRDQLEMEKEEIALSSLTPEFREGLDAFLKKRPPKV